MKTCKKLFSLLLVAVMLVAAIPFAGSAAAVFTEKQVHVVGTYNGSTVAETYCDLTNFDTDNKDHLKAAFTFGNPGGTLDESKYAISSGSYDSTSNTLTVILTDAQPAHTHTYTYTDNGNGTHTGTCAADGTTTQPEAHTYGSDDKCTVCGASKPAATTGYAKVAVVYLDENGNVKSSAGKTVILTSAYTGSTNEADIPTILSKAGVSYTASDDASATIATSGDTITITLKDKADTRYVLNLTVVTGTTSTQKTYKAAYTGSVDANSVLNGFGVGNDYTLSNYDCTYFNYDNNKTFTATLTAKATDADKYTVTCSINGNQYATKTSVTYTGSFDSTTANAQAILDAANITATASGYQKVTITKTSNNVVTIDLRNTVSIKVYNNASSYTTTSMDIDRPYVNYLGTTIINNSAFGGITVKDNSGASRFYTASQVNGGTAVVNANDVEVTIQRNGDSCTLNFLKSDGTVLETRKLYAGDKIGTLPTYTVGGVPAVWTYNGKPISAEDTYNFKTTSVNIIPYFGGISDVYVDVYINGNVKTMQTRVKVTDLVQNGVLYLNSDVKSAISSALRNSTNKNLTYTAFFDASTWSDFIKNKNTSVASEPYRVGDNSERQGAVYLYVMVNNATVKATDSTNPKTGDNVKLGVAAAVLAVAVVGFGAVIVVNKKKGVQ